MAKNVDDKRGGKVVSLVGRDEIPVFCRVLIWISIPFMWPLKVLKEKREKAKNQIQTPLASCLGPNLCPHVIFLQSQSQFLFAYPILPDSVPNFCPHILHFLSQSQSLFTYHMLPDLLPISVRISYASCLSPNLCPHIILTRPRFCQVFCIMLLVGENMTNYKSWHMSGMGWIIPVTARLEDAFP